MNVERNRRRDRCAFDVRQGADPLRERRRERGTLRPGRIPYPEVVCGE